MSALEDHLIENMQPPIVETEDEPDGTFVIDSDRAADWALRKIAQKQRRMDDNAALADDERTRIDQWLEKANRPLEHEVVYLTGLLIEYHRKILEEDERRKTVSLPAGSLKARKTPDGVYIADTFLDFAKTKRPEFVRTKHEIDRAAVKKAALNDGEVLPGVEVLRGDVRFSIDITRKDES